MAFELRPVKIIYIYDHVFINVVLKLTFLQGKFEMEFSGYGPYIHISIEASFFLFFFVFFPVSQSNLPLFLPLYLWIMLLFFPLSPSTFSLYLPPLPSSFSFHQAHGALSEMFSLLLKKRVHLAHWGHLNFGSNIFFLTLLTVKTDISKTLCISCGI